VHAGIWLTLLSNLVYLARRRTRRRLADGDLPRLSVLVPARNEEANLRRLLPTLLAQDYPDAEFVVMDDGSEDGTWSVLEAYAARSKGRLRPLRGDGPAPGWVGKVHALYRATREATGDVFLFLDADAELADAGALRRLVERLAARPDDTVMTGLPRFGGRGHWLVSLVPSAILTGLPWTLVRALRVPSLGALNGQCWMMRADDYRRLEPHAHVRDEVLEDVMIGRYLKREGMTPELVDVQDDVIIHMYPSFGEAWLGFRKNAYLILGGSKVSFVPLWIFFALTWVVAPVLAPRLLLSVMGLKTVTDRLCSFDTRYSLGAPLAYVLGSLLQADSAYHHWTGRVSWKGRLVGKDRG
jgi:glycosyltransferase involved in cell wall biosynthesis